ncbi:MAG: divergent PAP2 family protein [Vampirovibrionales bacterium]|jgi:acid phosphatase family membrane protein YuiD|nr:divergent PAP2 family protein [Vampirovibrionales bacterium]
MSDLALPLASSTHSSIFPVGFYNSGYEVIVSSLLSAFVAQLFKFIGTLLFKREINFRLMVETGGMPSSHSASMTALATAVGMVDGFSSTIFAVAVGIALVVMYDAAGVRRSAGRMAGILNKITQDIYTHETGHVPERLRELLGHTPFEVLVGGLLGIVFAIYFHLSLGSL